MMDPERIRAHLLTLPHVVETMQWGANLVFWVGDKAIGGKMFALVNLDDPSADEVSGRKARPLISYLTGPVRFSEHIEIDGLIPAPYFARAHWVAALRWDVFTGAKWKRELETAHALTLAKLPPKVRATLAQPASQQKRLIAAARKLAARKAPK